MSDLNDATQAGRALADLIKEAMSEDPMVSEKASPAALDHAEKLIAEVLVELLAVATSEGTTLARKRARSDILARLHSEDALGALAVLHRQRWPRFQQLMLRLRSTDGVPKGDISALEKAVAGMCDRTDDSRTRAGTPLQTLTRDLDPALRLLAPSGYIVDKAGVRTGEDVVAFQPLVISKVSIDATTRRERWTLNWLRNGSWGGTTLDRATCSDGRAIVTAAAGLGAPVHSSNQGAVVLYLSAFVAANDKGLTPLECVSRLGWHGDRYVCGVAGPIPLDDELAGRRSAWRSSGTLAGWKHALRWVSTSPVAWIGIYAAASPMMLRFLGLDHCPIVDFHAPPGRGKTSGALYAGGSLYGRPAIDKKDAGEGVIGTWSGTPTARKERAAEGRDVPLFLDDTKLVKDADRPNLGNEIYELASGLEKERSRRAGWAAPLSWRLVVLSTGEEPLTASTGAGGAKVRVLSVPSHDALPSREVAEALHLELLEHHGHVAPLFAAECLALGETVLRRRFETAKAGWLEQVQADTRLINTAALLSVAAWVLHDRMGVERPEVDPMAEDGRMVESLRACVEEADQGQRALDLVWEDVAQHARAYYRPGRAAGPDQWMTAEPSEPHGGWRGVDQGDRVCVLPGVLAAIWKGHDLKVVLQRLKEAGMLDHEPGRLTRNTRIGTTAPVKMYVFNRK